jgi:hypothetical protein
MLTLIEGKAQKTYRLNDSIELSVFKEYLVKINKFQTDSTIIGVENNHYVIKYIGICPCSPVKIINTDGKNNFEYQVNPIWFSDYESFIILCKESILKVKDKTFYKVEYDEASSNNNIYYPITISKEIFDDYKHFKAKFLHKHQNLILEKTVLLNIGNLSSTGYTYTVFMEKSE